MSSKTVVLGIIGIAAIAYVPTLIRQDDEHREAITRSIDDHNPIAYAKEALQYDEVTADMATPDRLSVTLTNEADLTISTLRSGFNMDVSSFVPDTFAAFPNIAQIELTRKAHFKDIRAVIPT